MSIDPETKQSIDSRRAFFSKSVFGLGALALDCLLQRESALATPPGPGTRSVAKPLAARSRHFPAKAKSVIFLFMRGGPSHVDTFDPKPVLSRLDGQHLPPSFQSEDLVLQFVKASDMKLMGSERTFQRHGESGLEISDLFENVAQHADRLAVIRSCHHDSFIHGPALSVLQTGSISLGHPSMGAWVVYGLGSECDNLPGYMVMSESNRVSTKALYGPGFLPAAYQGTMVRTEGPPLRHLHPPSAITLAKQRRILDRVNRWNERYRAADRQDDSRLAARLANYELAFRMQMAAPELIDVSVESKSVRSLYDIDEEATQKFGRVCLLARRMIERGVRFVELYAGGWDTHNQNDKNMLKRARGVDKPIAGLLADLQQRGLLESTLVVWTGEFGRTPTVQGNRGRDHNPYGFSAWMAGGGIHGGRAIGATDELGFRAVQDKVHVHDLHATMLSLLGLNHTQLTYFSGVAISV